MHLVLSSPGDPVAAWVAAGLGGRLGAPVTQVTADLLAGAVRWSHVVDPTGASRSEVRLADGRELRSAGLGTVYNRLRHPPVPSLERVAPADREYAVAEWHAVVLSWLAGLGRRVLNPPHPAALDGDWRGPTEWAALARTCGLRPDDVPSVRRGGPTDGRHDRRASDAPDVRPRSQVIVIGNCVIGPPAGHRLADELVALRRRSGSDVLGVDLVKVDGHWGFGSATTMVDLRRGGGRALDALAEMFGGGRAGSEP